MKRVLIKILIWSVVVAVLVFITMNTVDKMYEAGKTREAKLAVVVEDMQDVGAEFKIGNMLVEPETQKYIEDYLGGNELTAISQKHAIYRKLRRYEADDLEKASIWDKDTKPVSEMTEDIHKLDEIAEKTEYLYQEIQKAEYYGYREMEKETTRIILLATLLCSLTVSFGYILSSMVKRKPKERVVE